MTLQLSTLELLPFLSVGLKVHSDMFLIAKIVRGRRLLQELEQQEKDEAAAALDAAQSLSQVCFQLNKRLQFLKEVSRYCALIFEPTVKL